MQKGDIDVILLIYQQYLASSTLARFVSSLFNLSSEGMDLAAWTLL